MPRLDIVIGINGRAGDIFPIANHPALQFRLFEVVLVQELQHLRTMVVIFLEGFKQSAGFILVEGIKDFVERLANLKRVSKGVNMR